jgi:type IX secretion system PorP/SprF family membrane protein
MKMNKSILIIFLFLVNNASAQDGHLSMYDAAPLFLNPSLTGVFEADYRVHAQYRTQWKSVNFKPYTAGLISFDMPYKKWGVGGQIHNFRAGKGNFNAFQALGSVAYYIPLNRKATHILNFGLQGGLQQKSLEYQLLSFNNQYTTANGGGFNESLATNEDFRTQSQILPMLNGGLMYYGSAEKRRINPFAGISFFNLLTPRETFFDQQNKLPFRTYTHVGARINITELLYLVPKVMIMNQKEFNEQTVGLELGYFMKQSGVYLLAGSIFRNKDAGIFTLGARKANYIVKLGYDINVSSLSTASSGRGGVEIALTYLFKKLKPTYFKSCPRI